MILRGAAFNDQVPDANPELLHTSAEEDIVLESELLAVSYAAEVVDASTEADLKCQATSLEVGASFNPRGLTIPSGTMNFRQSS